ncbi:NIPA-like protein 2 [Carlito syrichta]|uniref:NIPA-like protein 2 n=1 Tax=Carlito syrichta TaxID=1868482 RepID=A0A3Q0DGC6_CARSF|nr:NIPA-like protein 2 [Carlito syrichta]
METEGKVKIWFGVFDVIMDCLEALVKKLGLYLRKYFLLQIHLFGVLLAILGNLVISISLNIQKYSHLQLAQQEHPKPYFKSVLWWSGILLLAVGETGNFAAYGFAPITLIAPLGCISVTGSAIISVMFLKENLRASDLLGMTLAFAGTYLLVNFAPNITQAVSARTIQYYFVGWQFLVYVAYIKWEPHRDKARRFSSDLILFSAGGGFEKPRVF